MIFKLFILFLVFLFIMTAADAGRVKEKWLAGLCLAISTLGLTSLVIRGASRGQCMFELSLAYFSNMAWVLMLCLLISFFACALPELFKLKSAHELLLKYKRWGQYLLFYILPGFLLAYHLLNQPDTGGNEACAKMSGLNIEKHYGGQFLPVYEFMPHPFYNRYQFRMSRKDFDRLTAVIENHYGGKLGQTYHGPETKGYEQDAIGISYQFRNINTIWIWYRPAEEILYIGDHQR